MGLMGASNKDDDLQLFIDAQGIFRQLPNVDELPVGCSLADVVEKHNELVRESEDAGVGLAGRGTPTRP